MTTIEYQKKAIRTMKTDMKEDDINFGIIGEFGEMTDCIKKIAFHNAYELEETLKKEIGDLMWYLSAYCEKMGVQLPAQWERLHLFKIHDCIYEIQFNITSILMSSKSFEARIYNIIQSLYRICEIYNFDFYEILDLNIEKLRIRYPEKYSDEASEKRIDVKGE